jgi:hypothetical protein
MDKASGLHYHRPARGGVRQGEARGRVIGDWWGKWKERQTAQVARLVHRMDQKTTLAAHKAAELIAPRHQSPITNHLSPPTTVPH